MASSSYIEIERFRSIPPPLSTVTSSSVYVCPCHRRPSSANRSLTLPSRCSLPILRWPDRVNRRPRFITAAAEPDRFDEYEHSGKQNEIVVDNSEKQEDLDLVSESQRKAKNLRKRIIFGIGIGISVGFIILAGGWIYTLGVSAAVFVASREYFELVRSRGITSGMTPPPRFVSRVCSLICALMPLITLYFGQLDVPITFAAFVVAMSLLLQRGNPRFSQLSSTIFGLFYCGYLPSFWIKLRCGLAAPALNSGIASAWPILLGGQAHWTVGLVATLISISSIIAADTFAFIGGKTMGRTPLISVSPKKTWEGTIVGLAGCVATSLILTKMFCWPTSLLSVIPLGILTFFGSIFGDLTESMIKRDAGVKDSGSLIPGHGGILDRVDSYIFTGALAYSFIKTFLPLYGV
ncbi:hypothetical protein ACFE04_019245 [Oxalis oulophora]